MLKEVLASNAAKLVAACVCPVVAGPVALKVSPVRSAIHKATAPQPKRTARAKPRIRVAADRPDSKIQTAALPLCTAPPVMFNEAALKPASLDMPVSIPAPDLPEPRFKTSPPANCGPTGFPGGGALLSMAAVPEPATWAQMIAGFALAGTALRRRRRRPCHIRVTSLS